jgi:hypothetical protein
MRAQMPTTQRALTLFFSPKLPGCSCTSRLADRSCDAGPTESQAVFPSPDQLSKGAVDVSGNIHCETWQKSKGADIAIRPLA